MCLDHNYPGHTSEYAIFVKERAALQYPTQQITTNQRVSLRMASDDAESGNQLLGSGQRRSLSSSSSSASSITTALPHAKEEHKVAWLDLSWLMLTDVVGTSVLAFAGVAAALGWVPTITLIVLACPVAIYTAMLMSRTYTLLADRGIRVGTMGEAALQTLGGKKGEKVVYTAVYGFALLGNSSYLLVLGKAMQGIFYDYDLCLPTATLISCFLVAPLVMKIRRLMESVVLCFINLILILGVLIICEYQLFTNGRSSTTKTFAFAENLSFTSIAGAREFFFQFLFFFHVPVLVYMSILHYIALSFPG